MVEQRVCGVEFSDLPRLDSRQKLNLTSDDMDDLQRQGIDVDDENGPSPENIPYEVPQPEGGYIWRSEGIICPR